MDAKYDKLILAVLQWDDYPDVVEALNEGGFYVTVLNSSGGFLKKRSVTIMVGLEESRLEAALEILKLHAGDRMETTFRPGSVEMTSVPMRVKKGGIIYFVMNIDGSGRF